MMAAYLPTVDPGMLVVWWPNGTEADASVRLFTGERGPSDAKKHVMQLLETGNGMVRAFSVLEMFQVVGASMKRIPDQWAPVLDLMMREQVLGKGLTTARRGPPKVDPEQYIADVAEGRITGGSDG